MDAEEDEQFPTPISDTRLVAAEDVIVTEVEGELVMLDRTEEIYYGLNEVGAFLWEELDEPRTVAELHAATAEAFDVTEAECRDDVHDFLGDILEAGLVTRA